jgi:hypothetical protein
MRTNRSRATKRRLQRAGLLLVVLAALAVPIQAVAGAQVPYKASDSGGYTILGTCAPGIFQIDINGTGTATLLGKYTYHAVECYDPVANAVTGEFTITAANGATIFGTYSGPCAGSSCAETAVVQGGTGRFAGAEGQLDVTVTVTGPETYSETASGTLSTPGSAA